VAVKSDGDADGMFVSPGLTVNTPVGAAGVPPQMQVVEACAGAAAPPVQARQAAAAAAAPTNARSLSRADPLSGYLQQLVDANVWGTIS
jgi:hypothetical protein